MFDSIYISHDIKITLKLQENAEILPSFILRNITIHIIR